MKGLDVVGGAYKSLKTVILESLPNTRMRALALTDLESSFSRALFALSTLEDPIGKGLDITKGYVLRWYNGDEPALYCNSDVENRKDAKLFATREAARAFEEDWSYFGAGGPKDLSGWKVVRIVKRAK